MRVLKQIDSLTKEQAVKFLTNIGIFETSTDLQNKEGGRYQMLESFREQMSMDTGLDIDKEFVNDPYKASALLINHLVNNFGSETDMMDYYYEHHYGNSGKGLRDRSRDELITNVFTPSQIRSNSYLTENNLRTVGDFIDYWEGPKREQTDKIIRDGKIQYMLKDLGYYFKNIDHNITKNGATEKAMKQFMEEKGLDKEDLEYLSEIYQKIPRESRIAYSRFGTLRDVNPVQASNMGEVASDIYDMMSRNNFDLEKTLPIVEKYGKAFEEGKVTNFLDIRDKVDMGFSYEDAIEASIEKSRVRDATITEGAQILTPIDSPLKEDITEDPIQMFSREGKIDPRIARARKRVEEGGREYREVVRDNTNTRRTQPQEQSKLTEDQRAEFVNDINQRVKERRTQDLRERQGEITEYTPQSRRDRVMELATNPMTAAGYLARGQEIPENFSQGPRNAYEDLIGFVNPAWYGQAAADVVDGVNQGDLVQAGLGGLSFLPIRAISSRLKKLSGSSGVEDGLKSFGKAMNQQAPVPEYIKIDEFRKKLNRELMAPVTEVPMISGYRGKDMPLEVVSDYANDDKRINAAANLFRKRGVSDAFNLSEAIDGRVLTEGLPNTLYRGVKIPMTEDAFKALPNKRVVEYRREGDMMLNNEGMLKMQEYAINPSMKRVQGHSGENVGGSNYLHDGLWLTDKKDYGQAYAHTGFKVENDLLFPSETRVVRRRGLQDRGDWPVGMIQEFTPTPNNNPIGITDLRKISQYMSKKLGKPLEEITLKESREFLKKHGIDYYRTNAGFKRAREYHVLPGKVTPTKSNFEYKKGGTIPRTKPNTKK